MDRRSFLKSLAAALAVPVLPAAVLSAPALAKSQHAPLDNEIVGRFDPKAEYGMALVVSTKEPEAVARAADLLREHARRFLPAGTKFYVLEYDRFDLGEDHCALAWLYTPKPLSSERRSKFIAEGIA